MSRRRFVIIGLLLVVLFSISFCSYGYLRHIDGRSPTQWLAFANRAGQTLSYHALGHSLTGKLTSRFILDQGKDGRYCLTTQTDHGQQCSLGFDGRELWYTAGSKHEKMAVAPTSAMPPTLSEARIIGTSVLSGRPVVQLSVRSGALRKMLSIDRATGIVLAMTTLAGHRVQSYMMIDHIEYRAVAVQPCACGCGLLAQQVDRTSLVQQLGETLIEPHWLPTSMVLTDLLEEPCPECGQPMGVLRYSDGIRAITIFEMAPAKMMCTMGAGCTQSADAHANVAQTAINGYAVTAVGNEDAATLNKVLTSMR